MANIGVPEHATKVTFFYGKGMDGSFHVWEMPNKKWQWLAFGNCGEEATQNEAINAARNWIIYEYNPLSDPDYVKHSEGNNLVQFNRKGE